MQQLEHTEVLELETDDIAEDDYIFVIDRNGNLKSVMMPEEFDFSDVVPDQVNNVMKLFGMTQTMGATIH